MTDPYDLAVIGSSTRAQVATARVRAVEADVIHEADSCTSEVLLARTGSRIRRWPIGEIVHDLDFKDGEFSREEASGIAGLVGTHLGIHQG